MTYLQPFQESSCETWKVGDGYGYSLSSNKKLVPRSSWNFDSTMRMVPRSNSGSDCNQNWECRIEMQKPNLKWEFPDAKIEQKLVWNNVLWLLIFSITPGRLLKKKKRECWLGYQYFFGNNCQFCVRVGFQIPWSITICYMVFKIIKK
jgi:hypothetical protein